MENIILLILCLTAGYGLKRTSLFDQNTPIVLNRLIIYFFIPLIAIHRVPKIEFDTSLIWLTLTPFLVFIGSFLFFQSIGRFFNLTESSRGALILTAGISSTSFVGFPIFEMLYGSEGLAYGVLLSLGGTILVFNTLGIATLFYLTSGGASVGSILKKLFSFVPFLIFLLALVINFIGLTYPTWLDNILSRLTSPFTILALMSIGMQIDLKTSQKLWKEILIGQSYKLILAPLIVYVLMWHILHIDGVVGRVCVLGAAIGSMNAMSILTAEKGLNPELSIIMPALGIPISIPLLFIIEYLIP